MKYQHVVLGGTFDHLHIGHTKLLSMSLELGKKVTIGLTTISMNGQKSFPDALLSYEIRKADVQSFARSIGREQDIDIIPLTDIFGSTLEDTTLEAIVVTEHTQQGAEQINAARKQRSLPPLEIHVCDLQKDVHGDIISSTRIRAGEINREGDVYFTLFEKDLVISEIAREKLRSPIGTSYPDFPTQPANAPEVLFLIGDVITEKYVQSGMPMTAAYTDGQSHRERYSFPIPAQYSLIEVPLLNPAGTITEKIADHVRTIGLVATNTIFHIQGEEDLLTAVAVLAAPLGSNVAFGNAYGTPGITLTTVNEESKQWYWETLHS